MTRELPPASSVTPKPSMTISSVPMNSSPVVSWIVCPRIAERSMVSASRFRLACSSASRRLPAPLSFVLVTEKFAAGAMFEASAAQMATPSARRRRCRERVLEVVETVFSIMGPWWLKGRLDESHGIGGGVDQFFRRGRQVQAVTGRFRSRASGPGAAAAGPSFRERLPVQCGEGNVEKRFGDAQLGLGGAAGIDGAIECRRVLARSQAGFDKVFQCTREGRQGATGGAIGGRRRSQAEQGL